MSEQVLIAIITAVVSALGTGGLCTLIMFFVKRYDDKHSTCDTRVSAIEDGVKGLLHTEIIEEAEKYRRVGSISFSELDDFEKYLYKPYKALGGNGSAEVAYNMLKDLQK